MPWYLTIRDTEGSTSRPTDGPDLGGEERADIVEAPQAYGLGFLSNALGIAVLTMLLATKVSMLEMTDGVWMLSDAPKLENHLG